MSLDVFLFPPDSGTDPDRPALYEANITHNLTLMADKAGIYEALWRPETRGLTRAKDLIPLLEEGVRKMRTWPDYYRTFDAANAWGTYDQFLPWIEDYLSACREHPEAEVFAAR